MIVLNALVICVYTVDQKVRTALDWSELVFLAQRLLDFNVRAAFV